MTPHEVSQIRSYCQIHGISLKQYCRENDIAYHKWLYWSKKHEKIGSTPNKPTFLQVIPESATYSKEIILEAPNGWKIYLKADLQAIIREFTI